MGTLNPQNPNFASSTEPSFSHQFRSGRLSAGRCRHTGKNARNRKNWSQENLERCADVWATEFVQAHLRSHLASWLWELDSLFPDKLSFGTFRVGLGSGREELFHRHGRHRELPLHALTRTGTRPARYVRGERFLRVTKEGPEAEDVRRRTRRGDKKRTRFCLGFTDRRSREWSE